MKAATSHRVSLFVASLALGALACGPSGPSIEDLNNNPPAPVGGSSTQTAGSGGAPPMTAGSGGAPPMTGGNGGSGAVVTGGSAGSTPGGGAGPTAGTGTGGGGGTGGGAVVDPIYGDRSGTFKMLVLTRTTGYRHAGSIGTGRTMLDQIATEQGFEPTYVDTAGELDAAITAENLANYEIIFHLNTTGGIFTPAQKQIYEDWMTTKGAFAGVHAATDTENGWAFYSEVTGQYYDLHTSVTSGTIEFEPTMAEHPAVKGLPNPWSRQEEWYKFNQWQNWSTKPGFKLLSKRTGVAEHAEPTAFMWIREWSNFRAFYTALGHDAVVFQDPNVKKHVAGGIMWAVRRGHLLK